VLPWPVQHAGGVNEVVRNLYRRIAITDAFVPRILVVSWDHPRPFATFEAQRAVSYMRLRALDGVRLFAVAKWAALVLPDLWRLARHLRTHGVTHVNVHFPTLAALQFVLLRRLFARRLRVVLSFHGQDVGKAHATTGLERPLWRWLLRRADAVVSCSNALRESIVAFDPALAPRVSTVHNGIDMRHFLTERNASARVDSRLRGRTFILCVASYEHKKGIDTLLHAFASLRARNEGDVKLAPVGPDRGMGAELRALAQSLALSDHVVFVGEKAHEDLHAYYQAATLFCLPSRAEPFGIVLLEAATLKCPVVATAVGGIPEVLTHDVTARLVAPDDPAALAAQISGLLGDPEARRRLANALRDHVQAHFSWDRPTRAYLALAHRRELDMPMPDASAERLPGPGCERWSGATSRAGRFEAILVGASAPSMKSVSPPAEMVADADDLARLAAAWQGATDPAVRVSLASALGRAVSTTQDHARASAFLAADECTDAIRCEVARRTRDAERRRTAIAAIRDVQALIQLATATGDAALRDAAAARLQGWELEDATSSQDRPTSRPAAMTERVFRYVPRVLQQHLADDPDTHAWIAEGSAALVDISGFTELSEQLARKGREGAEHITDAIGKSFEAILLVAYENGASLLKFGGDAMLLWFSGKAHAARACRAAFRMRDTLHEVGKLEVAGATVSLRMSQGVHSGEFHFFTVGTSHVELLPTGPAWSRVATMERQASANEILISAETAALIAEQCVGETTGEGRLLVKIPPGGRKLPLLPRPPATVQAIAQCLSPPIRAHVLGGGGASEHRPVTIAFLRYEGVDSLMAREGLETIEAALQRLVDAVSVAADKHGVAFLASDVDVDGGKLILTGGAPSSTGNDEERMLLALRDIVATELPLPVRVGVHRGAVFAGDIGPPYRRTYTVMGDAVNLAARLMARAEPGQIYATADVLDRCQTAFETVELEPFPVKGKAEPVRARSVGRAKSGRTREIVAQRLPLTGRNAELGIIRKAYASARGGAGRVVDVVGPAGIGKTRLLEALRDAAAGFRKQNAVCEAYTASTPYALWRELLREILGFGRDDDDIDVLARVRDEIAARSPHLVPWLPLIAIALGIEMPATAEVEMLAETNRRDKLHECVWQFLEALLDQPTLIEIDDAHHMDGASADLLAFLLPHVGARPWLLAVAHRGDVGGFAPGGGTTVVGLELKPLAAQDAVRLAQLATQQTPLAPHVLERVAQRSGGNPQFLRDLLRSALVAGGDVDLPESAEAAAMAEIDALAPEDRSVVRRASVFGLTFHPRMLEWVVEDGEAPPSAAAWSRLHELFGEEQDGYLRFRRSLLRDAAYEGLPFKLRRKLHGAIAARLEQEANDPEEAAGALSLHYFEAGEFASAWRYARVAGERAEGAFADVEAARLYARALDAARHLPDLPAHDVAAVHMAIGDACVRAGDLAKALTAFTAARPLVADDRLREAGVLLKLSQADGRLGNYGEALKWVQESRTLLTGLEGPEAARQVARSSGRYAIILQVQGHSTEALEWAERAVAEADAADDAEAVGDAYVVMGWAHGELGKPGAKELLQRSVDAYRRSGNRVQQAMVLSDLGVVCQWDGQWEEAASYYEQAREESLKIGSTTSAAMARVNLAEILNDRGEWAEAEAAVLETLPFFRTSRFRYLLAACLAQLGQVVLRLGRVDDARGQLEEARAIFVELGAENVLPPIDARLAECRLAKGDADGCLEIVGPLLARLRDAANGSARVVPLLERLQGHALMMQNDLWGARDALEASLAGAQEQHNSFEAALTMLSLMELDRLEGIEPAHEMVTEAQSIIARLKVRAVPPVPKPAA
jgi:glycosyltransferase involved in cell wall biosynthesis/class 3 adenylate cyclase/tetratricopeptide (TPR) repeat protein